uniref:Uncharacterized protein n=1 Tax=Rhizophora mucronata TaxID=61149 RepID=A0A2P2MNH5_RHIMU
MLFHNGHEFIIAPSCFHFVDLGFGSEGKQWCARGEGVLENYLSRWLQAKRKKLHISQTYPLRLLTGLCGMS